MSSSNFIIDVRNLAKSFANVAAVKNISLQVRYGEIFGFLGPNGSGKTTLIRMLCGLLTPDQGSGECIGHDLKKQMALIKKQVGYVPQAFSLYKRLTIGQNILLMAELYSVVNREERVKDVMYELGLYPYRDKLAGALSGGWKQRLALAGAIIHKPSLLFLDEPTANVDPESRQIFWDLLRSLSSQGMTILLSTHNMAEVQHCSHLAYMFHGEMIMKGSPWEIQQQANLFTWEVQGKDTIPLAKELEVCQGVEQVITFFDTLHVSGQNLGELEQAIKPYKNLGYLTWRQINPTLEDIFIWLTRKYKLVHQLDD
ncbi:ABC transporter ATP-binding protein [Legionella saoudiensis]|uniref:ABC transporter ATP-binding protein n=1 Tax=Legionella saoudiensis TaxID=1750561 RepID=UPI0007319B66|nr:ABC transporter ATP-binding protein [Legionella saoudiensis]